MASSPLSCGVAVLGGHPSALPGGLCAFPSVHLQSSVSAGLIYEMWHGCDIPGALFVDFLSSAFQVTDIMKYLFPVPKDESRRIITLANDDDYISFRCVSCTYMCVVELTVMFSCTKKKC